jgi:hypothetical protein
MAKFMVVSGAMRAPRIKRTKSARTKSKNLKRKPYRGQGKP